MTSIVYDNVNKIVL